MQDESHSFEISIVTNHASVVLARLVLHVGDWGRSKQLQKPFLSAAREADLNSLPPKEYEASKVLLFSVPGRQYLGTMIARRIGDWSNRKYRKLRNGRGMCKFVEIQNGRRHVNASRQSLPTWRRTATTTTGETHTAAMDLNHLAVRGRGTVRLALLRSALLQFQLPNVASGQTGIDCLFLLPSL